nr:type I-B CRISPR-associated protein Cas5b [uncultured Draconibacterium sp.]
MKKVISFDLYADMGFLKKPDINEKIYLTYNMLHKPCLLGILGAIAGLKGFTKNNEFPEYYKKFKDIPVGIKPIGDGCERGNFTKNVTTYTNTIGFANADGNLIVSEQTLIHPAYRIFLLLDLEKEDEQTLYNRIRQQEATFIPYLGKNDYSAWWRKEDVKEYSLQKFEGGEEFQIETIFIKEDALVDQVVEHRATFRNNLSFLNGSFMYFEKLPIGYNPELYQYDYADFAYTDWRLSENSFLTNLYKVDNLIVQLN